MPVLPVPLHNTGLSQAAVMHFEQELVYSANTVHVRLLYKAG